MGPIKKIPLDDMDALVELVNRAYPGLASYDGESKKSLSDRFRTIQQEEPDLNFYGYYSDNQLVGAMRLHNYQMNMNGKTIPVGGIGLVAVDLLHKKEKVAKALLTFFIDHYHEKKCAMTLLYPFRPDFYRKMGFGFGTKMDSYKIKPSAFRNYKEKRHLRYLSLDDQALVQTCYERFQKRHHGMIEKQPYELKQLLSRSDQYVIGYEKDGELLGYFPFTFKQAHKSNTMINDLHVGEFIYLESGVLKEFSSFLNSQADQINRIVINTQDEHFHFLFDDPRNGTDVMIPHVYHETNISGVGLMYRVHDLPLLFNQLHDHCFGQVTCTLNLTIRDSFYPKNNSTTTLHFQNGFATIVNSSEADVTISLDVADFSSLIMGSLSFESLVNYGRVELSDESFLPTLNQLFFSPNKPICRTGF